MARRWFGEPPAAPTNSALPTAVAARRGESLLDYHRSRLAAHTNDSYASLPIQKFPEDLRVYEHLLWSSRCNVVIELGTNAGGSTLWFRDRLVDMARYGRIRAPRVIAVDIVADQTAQWVRQVDPDASHITFVQADVTDRALPDRVAALLRPDDRPFVIEDSAHEYDTTMSALVGFSRFVPSGGYFVVEDTCVDDEDLRIDPRWPRGVAPALTNWLGTEQGQAFLVDRSLELYGLSCHPGGFLRRI